VFDFLQVNILSQQLLAFKNNILMKTFVISSAKNGVGEIRNSFCTPRGLHKVRAKIGKDLPIGAILRGRRFSGEIFNDDLYKQNPNSDWILSRILWLSGLEKGKNLGANVDTFARFIYIHGTPYQNQLGMPNSFGCIRMSNNDVIELFDLTPLNCHILIN